MKVVFMGTPDFAVPSLEELSKNHEVLCVVCQPDKPKGRGKKMVFPVVKEKALELGIEVHQPEKINNAEFIDELEKYEADIFVVAAYGQILNERILNMPKYGCINVHGSLLPQYRGAGPIQKSIMDGCDKTGVTIMQMEKGLDTGPVYELHRMAMPEQITTGELEQQLSQLAGEKIGDCLIRVTEGLVPVAQGTEGVTVSVKIRKTDGAVDFREDAMVIARKVRAFYGWPSMTFRAALKNRTINVKIMRAKGISCETQGQPGEFIAYTNNQMMIRCGNGALAIERVLPEGKKEMPVSDFLNGCHISVGDILLNGMD